MKRLFWPLVAFVVMMVIVPMVAVASDGVTALSLATSLYCGTKGVIEGNVGLLMGLVLAAMGIWALIQGQSLATGLILIIFGSLITALPSLIESTLTGFGDMLVKAEIAKSSFSPGQCGGASVSVPNAADLYGTDPWNGETLQVTKEFGRDLSKPQTMEPQLHFDMGGQ